MRVAHYHEISVNLYHVVVVTSQNKENFIGFVGNQLNMKVLCLKRRIAPKNGSLTLNVTYIRHEHSNVPVLEQ
jgi:hypothetical protein